MTKALVALITIVAAFFLHGAAWAETTTVVLSDDNTTQFSVRRDKQQSETMLKFNIGSDFPVAEILKCTLRVVSVNGVSRQANQDVTVYKGNTHVGQWSTNYRPPLENASLRLEEHTANLKWEACTPGSTSDLTLKTESEYTNWSYYGGAAKDSANKPRLIVTYKSPEPVRSGRSTNWKYATPASFFSSPLFICERTRSGMTARSTLSPHAPTAIACTGRPALGSNPRPSSDWSTSNLRD
jgi:hypothetical protein